VISELVTCFARRRVYGYGFIAASSLLIAILGGTRAVMANSTSHEYSKDEVLASMQLLQRPVPATVARDASPPPATTLPPLRQRLTAGAANRNVR